VAAKVMAALGAVFLVAGFALASLLQPFTSLAQLAAMLDDKWMLALDHAERSGVARWLWVNVEVPVLLRPCWLLPITIGLICVGFAVSFALSDRRA
jgi:hypothetical protein